jgi:hypothetical protein
MNLEYNKHMAAIDFPNSPTIGQEFSTASTIYVWTGSYWQVKQPTISSSSFSSLPPVMNGSASAGTSGLASRSDHVHPTDTSRAPIDSPNFIGTVSFSGATVTGIDLLPSQTGNSGKYLTTNGTAASWATVDALPSQTGNSGKYLTTDGTTASWATLDLSLYAPLASPALTGTPSAPTAAVDTNTTQIATTAFVIGQGYLKSSSASTTYEPIISSGTTGQYWRGDKSWQTLDKAAVGLSNVENTALSTWAGSSNITTLGTISTLTLETADSAAAASHYFMETASDGVVRPKTLANVRTEIVTDSAVQSAVVSPTAAGSNGVRDITISTSAATGGNDGDVWLTYV